MRRERNNEIDLLLQRMARSDNTASDSEARTSNRHLDTDELSSYAQKALPAAARARYTEHLTECATCRKLVTELSLSLGAAAVAAPFERADQASGLKRFVASLFSPLVLRYAVPALGVIVVMIVGVVVLRRQEQHKFIAQLADDQKAAAPLATPSAQVSPADVFTDKQSKEIDKAESGNSKPSETKQKTAAASGNASEAAPATAPARVPVGPAKDDPSAAQLRPTVAAEPPPPASRPAATTETGAQNSVVVINNQNAAATEKTEPELAKGRPDDAPRDEAQRAKQNETSENKTKQKSSSTAGFMASGVAGVRRRAGESKGVADAKRDDSTRNAAQPEAADEETRTIAGRHFRKEHDIWIDTAYTSSTATVNMARNSEQFRALVADEPAIGTIVKQLDGEVIVVWKDRAYRIR
jgi:hypothetical protein